MTKTQQAIEARLKQLDSSAQQLRLEAMQVGALLLAKMDTLLAQTGAEPEESSELAVLKARYDRVMRLASDTQDTIDKLGAEQHEIKYYR